MSQFLNARYASLEAYTPGEQPRDKRYIKLNTNESPYPPAPEVVAAMDSQQVEDLRLYSDPTGKALREKIGMVPQKAMLFAGTVRDNLLWGKREGKPADDDALNEALSLAQAKAFIDEKEGGLDFVIEQNGRNLSGGQRQRLTIARALVGRPEIIILDDSASALDYATDAALRKSLGTLSPDSTVFIISQRASSLRHADQIVVLEDGEVEGIGTHEELLKTCPVYAEIYRSQFEEEDN